MTTLHKLLIYNQDAAMRRAYATYLNKNGIPTDSCGTLPEMIKLFSWHQYEFVLINVDNLNRDVELVSLRTPLSKIIEQHQPDVTLIATSGQQIPATDDLNYAAVLQEPLTPKSILTTVSRLRQAKQSTDRQKGHLKLRRYLSKPVELPED